MGNNKEQRYRSLTQDETSILQTQGNRADDWSQILIDQYTSLDCLWGNTFGGRVVIGILEKSKVYQKNLTLNEGIYNSTIADCAVGNHAAIHNVGMLSGYHVGNNVILFNVDEMTCTTDPRQLEWTKPMNENGGRPILPFPGMTVGEAYLWARYRGRHAFVQKLEQFTYDTLSTTTGCYGNIGDNCVVKNCRALRNISVISSADDPTRIDGCVVLSDGVVGSGCIIEHGVVAMRFLLGEHVHLEYGLRLSDTVVGDNSTLACCEIGNSFIFPAHEQHHNNSFLIAGLVMGQSNIAAGCTIGSNHNSRTADGELSAGRGFWPGLCCSFKHHSRFASYCLVAKGDYPAELDIKLPFALVNNNVAENRLEVMPAYWWMFNMYALNRNSHKFAQRDKRTIKAQHIETDPLAPDTAEEILQAMQMLREWMSRSDTATVTAPAMENSHRTTAILKASEGLEAYEEMLTYYAMKTLVSTYGQNMPDHCFDRQNRQKKWLNIGGQLVAEQDLEQLIADVVDGVIDGWNGIGTRLDELWAKYPSQRNDHAYHVLCAMAGVDKIDCRLWAHYLERYEKIKEKVADQIAKSRLKDTTNPFRHSTCWDDDEWKAVMG